MTDAERIKELEARVEELEEDVAVLRAANEALANGGAVVAAFDWSPPLAKRSGQ